MPRLRALTLIAMAALFAVPARAAGQLVLWEDRAFLNLSAGIVGRGVSQERLDSVGSAVSRQKSRVWDVTGGVRTGLNSGFGSTYLRRTISFAPSAPPAAAASYGEHLVAPLYFYMVPMTDRLDIMALGGPALARVDDPSAGDVQLRWGYHVGGDIRYLLTGRLAAGVYVRRVSLRGAPERRGPGPAGFQAGAGLRIRFR